MWAIMTYLSHKRYNFIIMNNKTCKRKVILKRLDHRFQVVIVDYKIIWKYEYKYKATQNDYKKMFGKCFFIQP